MRMELFCRRRAELVAAGVFVCIALLCASQTPTIVAQKVVDLSTAFRLPKGFFVLNVRDNGILGANYTDTKWLTGGVSYANGLVNTQFFLFNLTYNRTATGGSVPQSFDSSQYFEINLLGTLSTPEFLQWNVYAYRDQVDLYKAQANSAEWNALFAFQLVDAANKVYSIITRLNTSLCVATIGGGVDFVLQLCQPESSAQRFQLIDAFSPNAPVPSPGTVLDVSAAYSLPKGFFISNVLDNAVLGANYTTTWQLSGGTAYAKALINSDFYLFNLTYNRTATASGGNAPPNFDASQYFEINLLATLSNVYRQWNVYAYKDQVDLYSVQPNTAELNALFAFQLVDQVNKVYIIETRLNASYCVSTSFGGVDFILRRCQSGNNAQRFQLISPFGGTDGGSSDSNFFSTAGGVVVILLLVGVGLGAAYGGWRVWQKRSQTAKPHKSGSSSQPALLASLTNGGGQTEPEDETQGSYRKIGNGDNMELGNVQQNNGHSGRASTRGASPNEDY